MSCKFRRFVPRLEVLGDRTVPTVVAGIVDGHLVLQIRGDAAADTVTIADDGTAAGVRVYDNDVLIFETTTPILALDVDTGAGNDTVVYNLTGPLTVSRPMQVLLGRGADTFTANLDGQTIASGGRLTISAFGDGGGDTLAVTAAGTTVDPAGFLGIDFHGQAGKDSITFDPSLLPSTNVVLTKDQKH